MKRLILALVVHFICLIAFSQNLRKLDSIPVSIDKYLSAVDKKAARMESMISKKSLKYLSELEKSEKAIRKIIAKKDSLMAFELFNGVKEKYEGIYNKFSGIEKNLERVSGAYFPLIDSIKTSIKFLEKVKPEKLNELTVVMGDLDKLQSKLNTSLQFEQLLKDRQALLESKLASLNMVKEFKKYKQQVYYYRQQLKEFKNVMNEPEKVIASSLQYLQKVPAFADFYRKHSILSSLFQLPGNIDMADPASLAGLQTRVDMQNIIQQKQSGNLSTPQQSVQVLMDKAQGELSQLKDKLNKLGGMGGSDEPIPDFKPNGQKTKSFWNRLEIGTNFQTVRGNYLFPITTDFGLSIGYKLNDISIIGIGASYKMGWGESYQKIKITHQGAGLRTFIDIKVKGSIFISGGGEMNYRNVISSADQLKDFSAWQKSGLIGATKKFQLNKKLKGNIQLLWDFLSYTQVPRSQPILFRVGYYFK
jgi:hypothetical protein